MTHADAFISGERHTYARSLAARPMPLAFGEVAEIRRRRTFLHVVRDALVGLALLVVSVAGVMALSIMVMP